MLPAGEQEAEQRAVSQDERRNRNDCGPLGGGDDPRHGRRRKNEGAVGALFQDAERGGGRAQRTRAAKEKVDIHGVTSQMISLLEAPELTAPPRS